MIVSELLGHRMAEDSRARFLKKFWLQKLKDVQNRDVIKISILVN